MASILRVNTLTDASSNNSTAMSTINQGTVKSWAKYNAGSSLNDSFNVATLTDSGTGLYDLAFTNNMNNANYAGQAEGNNSGFFPMPSSETTDENTTSKFRDSRRNTSHTLFDSAINRASIKGDLA
tara:strand:- start:735 stop:1112 length:378 start_codon:yes stop_codon:yes gene_type:complete